MNKLLNKISKWANDRNIIQGSNPLKQHDKLIEEVMETRDAIVSYEMLNKLTKMYVTNTSKWDAKVKREIKDGIGDAVVVLQNLAEMYGFTLEECTQHAYDEIKDRKGMMLDGTYVKYDNLTDEQKSELDASIAS